MSVPGLASPQTITPLSLVHFARPFEPLLLTFIDIEVVGLFSTLNWKIL
jgi:hypothetical protein